MLNKLNNNGYIFIKINKDLKDILLPIRDFLKKEENTLLKLDESSYYKAILDMQKKFNRKLKSSNFLNIYKDTLLKIFREKKYSIQHYFYLRAVKPKNKYKNFKPIDLHRESFQGPKDWKKIYNLWIPLHNCENKSALKFYPKSHKLIENKDFKIKLRNTKITKGSDAHKTGLLYKDRKLIFKKKIIKKRLFKKNNIILFSGELIHGNGENLTKKIRFSLDARFILTKHMKTNPVQSATNKKYFISKTI